MSAMSGANPDGGDPGADAQMEDDRLGYQRSQRNQHQAFLVVQSMPDPGEVTGDLRTDEV